MNKFMGNYVLEEDPNDVEPLQYNYTRLMTSLDNNTGIEQIGDRAGFITQQYSWWAKGRERHAALRDLFYTLDGRRTPIWIPTFYTDFELVGDIEPGAVTFDVRRCGYTETGGPFAPNRRHILIHLRDDWFHGTRMYRTILSSALLGADMERLHIDTPLARHLTPPMVRRISFLVLSRLDTDEIEFVHYTDTIGVTTVKAPFHNQAGIEGIDTIYEVPVDPDAPPIPEDAVDDPFHD